MTRAWVYMLSNRPGGVLYTGMCNADLRRRMWEHRQSGGSSFADKYNCKRLVWFAAFSDVTAAAEHERHQTRPPHGAPGITKRRSAPTRVQASAAPPTTRASPGSGFRALR